MDNKESHKILKEVVMLLVMLVKKNSMKSSLIQDFHSVGFKPKRIAEFLDTTPNTVRVALHHMKKKNKSKKEYARKKTRKTNG